MSTLKTISPIDGRYYRHTLELSDYFSEYALIKHRIFVEIEYFIFLSALESLKIDINTKSTEQIRNIYLNFSEKDALEIKEIEQITNHDVKAVEYFLKKRFTEMGIGKFKEFIHFGLTSQDINNTAIPIATKSAMEDVIIPNLDKVIAVLIALSDAYKFTPLLARTHGQPASPTYLGKEIFVFAERLQIQRNKLSRMEYSGKFGGATGNLNAHKVSYPNIDWRTQLDDFLPQKLGLSRQKTTTQIEHYDGMAELFHTLSRINTILTDLSRDFWTYISMDYFKQKVMENEVGSSAMPHKVNPIDFENAEGNLSISIALLNYFANKLPVSRLQRDLTDSTVIRNIGVPIAHSLIAYKSIIKGFEKLVINPEKINADLQGNYLVIAEAIQTILRREGIEEPYEKLKVLTRNHQNVGKLELTNFIQNLEISDAIKTELLNISPENYTGYTH